MNKKECIIKVLEDYEEFLTDGYRFYGMSYDLPTTDPNYEDPDIVDCPNHFSPKEQLEIVAQAIIDQLMIDS